MGTEDERQFPALGPEEPGAPRRGGAWVALLVALLLPPLVLAAWAGRLAPGAAPLVTLAASLYATLLMVALLWLGGRLDRLETRLRRLSLTDPLTGAYNRLAFETLGEQWRRLGRREGVALSLIVFDLDDLERINHAHGYAAGSRLIADFAGLLQSCTRASDIVARLGGDEFAVLMRCRPEHVTSLLTRLEAKCQAFNADAASAVALDYCHGEAVIHPEDADSLTSLLAAAERRLAARQARKRAWSPGKAALPGTPRGLRP